MESVFNKMEALGGMEGCAEGNAVGTWLGWLVVGDKLGSLLGFLLHWVHGVR